MKSRKLQTPVYNFPCLQVAFQVIQIFVYFSFCDDGNTFRMLQRLSSFLELHHFEDMNRKKNPELFSFISLILKSQYEGTKRIIAYEKRDWYLDLVSLRNFRIFERIPSYFIVVGIQNFSFHFSESKLAVIADMKKEINLVGLFKLRNDSNFQTVGLMEEFFVFKARPPESDFKLFI